MLRFTPKDIREHVRQSGTTRARELKASEEEMVEFEVILENFWLGMSADGMKKALNKLEDDDVSDEAIVSYY